MAIGTLALGIAAEAAVFSLVDGVLFSPLPYPEPDQLVTAWRVDRLRGGDRAEIAPADFRDWREQCPSFDDMAAYWKSTLNLVGTGDPERLNVARITPNLFKVIGVDPALGRAPGEDGLERAVVLSHGLWQRRFGADPGVVGRTVSLDGGTYFVVGVMPRGFRYLDVDLWMTPALPQKEWAARNQLTLNVIGRLRPGVRIDEAQASMSTIAQRLAQTFPASNADVDVALVPLHELVVEEGRAKMLAALGAVTFILLLACGNVANLMLARSSARTGEIAIHASLGATRRRLAMKLASESAVIAALAGGLGVMLAIWGVDVILKICPRDMPRLDNVGVNLRTLQFALGLSVLTCLTIGLIPTLQLGKLDIYRRLKDDVQPAAEGRLGIKARQALIVVEVALGLVLLVGASLLSASFRNLQLVDPGFRSDGVVSARIELPRTAYADGQQQAAFFDEVCDRVAALPGVSHAGAVTALPMSGQRGFIISMEAEGDSRGASAVLFDVVGGDYFETMGIPLKRGRLFRDLDSAGTSLVVIINEAMAQEYWPGLDPVNRTLTLYGEDESPPARRVVGVVGNVKLQDLATDTSPRMYLPLSQNPTGQMSVVARGSGEFAEIATGIRYAVRALDRNQPVSAIFPVEEYVYGSASGARFLMQLFSILSGFGLLLAAGGVYAVVSYAVGQTTREIGIRMALGANANHVVRMIIGRFGRLVLIGCGIGLLIAGALSATLETFLFHVSALDLWLYTFALLLFSTVALAACYLPARRAARIDPMTALNRE